MQGFTQADFETTVVDVKENGQQINDDSSRREKDDSGIAHGYFMAWRKYDAENGRFEDSQIPDDPKPRETTSGSKYYMLGFRIMMTKCIHKDLFIEVREPDTDDGKQGKLLGYKVKCSIRFSKKKGKKHDARDFLQEQAAAAYDEDSDMDPRTRQNIRRLVDKDGNVVDHLTVDIGVDELIDCTLSTFKQLDITNLSSPTSTGKLPFRCFVPVKLIEVSPRISVDVYSTKESTRAISIWDPSFWVKKMIATSTEATDSRVVLDHVCGKTPRFHKPILSLRNGEAEMPRTIKYYVTDEAMLYDNTVIRAVAETTHTSSYLNKDTNAIRRFFTVVDKIKNDDGSDSKYILRFTAWPKTCAAFGMDPHQWYAVMSFNQGLPFYLFANYKQQPTMMLEANNDQVLLEKKQGDPEGTFEFGVTAIFPDYVTWFSEPRSHVLELSPDEVIGIFKATNKDTPDTFDTSLRDDGQRKFFFQAVREVAVNPLHINGLQSTVLCLGSGPRPTISCRDASSVFTNTRNKFYAMLGVDVMDKADFIKKANQKTIPYQFFVVQNFDPVKEKNV